MKSTKLEPDGTFKELFDITTYLNYDKEIIV